MHVVNIIRKQKQFNENKTVSNNLTEYHAQEDELNNLQTSSDSPDEDTAVSSLTRGCEHL